MIYSFAARILSNDRAYYGILTLLAVVTVAALIGVAMTPGAMGWRS